MMSDFFVVALNGVGSDQRRQEFVWKQFDKYTANERKVPGELT